MADSSVIRLTGAPVTWESKVLTAVLGAGPAAVASHRTAAALWRLEGCRRGMPEISIPRGRTYRRTGVRVHQSTDLDRTTPIVLNAIPTTRGPRALLDLGAVVTSQQVHLATDDARRRNLTNWPALLDTLVAHARPGRDGVGILRAILDAHFGEVAVTDSGFERLVAITLCEAGLPPPSLQYEVSFGRKRYRFDLAYPDRMIGIELDGSTHLVRAVWEADHGRQNALVNAGWTVLRFTWRDYTERRAALIHDVKTAHRQARRAN